MNAAALIIGYTILIMLGFAIALFGFALGWFAIHEARTVIRYRKKHKQKLDKMELETARDCACYLKRWPLPDDITISEACEIFGRKVWERK